MTVPARRRLGYSLAALASVALVLASLREGSSLSPTEVLGFVTGGWCVWLVTCDNIWNWPLGIVNAAFFVVLFWDKALYADACLQVVYIVLSVLGWYTWLRGGKNRGRLGVRRIGRNELAGVTVAFIASTGLATIYLRSVGDAAPFLDGLTTCLSLAAQYMLTRKFIENWYAWMVADVVYVGLYISRGLHLTSLLYLVFLAMCFAGVIHWRRLLEDEPPADDAGPARATGTLGMLEA